MSSVRLRYASCTHPGNHRKPLDGLQDSRFVLLPISSVINVISDQHALLPLDFGGLVSLPLLELPMRRPVGLDLTLPMDVAPSSGP